MDFEISVVRSSCKQGLQSFGSFGPEKLFISGSGGPCRDSVKPQVWELLLIAANDTAAQLNDDEAKVC